MTTPTVPLRHVADVWASNVDKLSVEGEVPVQLCNYVDAYRNDYVRPSESLMRATVRPDELSRFHLEVGDTVLTKDSEDPHDIGISAYVAETAPDLVCGYHLAIARPRSGTHPRYLCWAVRSRPALNHFTNNSNGISRYGLSASGIASVPVPMPPLEEQRRIADFLDDRVARIDRIIAGRHQQVTLMREQLRSWVRRVTVAGIGVKAESAVTGVPWMPSIRADWSLRRVGHVFTTGSGTTPKSDSLEYYDGTFPWVTTSDLRDNEIFAVPRGVSAQALEEYSALQLFAPGTLLVAMYGATVGRTGILRIEACTNQACCALRPLGQVDVRWAFHWFNAYRSDVMSLASGGGQPNISQETVRNLRMPVPPFETQRELLDEIDKQSGEVSQALESLGSSVVLLQEYKQSLITAAVTGELDVTTASSRIPE